jgi:hypothetical protein
VAAVFDDAHLAQPLTLSNMTEQNGGGADLAQDFDFAVANPKHMVACIALTEQDFALLELISGRHV